MGKQLLSTQLLRRNGERGNIGQRRSEGELGGVKEGETVLGCILREESIKKKVIGYIPLGYSYVAFDHLNHSKIITFITIE